MNPLARSQNLRAVPRTGTAVRRAVLVFAALVAVLLSAPPVRAELVDSQAVVYNGYDPAGQPFCVTGYAYLTLMNDPRFAQGFYMFNGVVSTKGCPGACRTVPAGQLAVMGILFYWNSTSWVACTTVPWNYSTNPAASFSAVNNYVATGKTPCGPGYYGLDANAYASDGSAWRGGWVWSGYLYSQ